MYMHSGAVTKSDVITSNMHSCKRNFVMSKGSYHLPWKWHFIGNVAFRAIIGTGKKNFLQHFLQSFWVTKCFYARMVIKHNFLIHLHLLGPTGGVSGSGFNTSLGVQQSVLTSKVGLSLILSHFDLPGNVLVNGAWPWLYSFPWRFMFMMLILIRRPGFQPRIPK